MYLIYLSSFSVKSFKSVQNVQSRQVKCGLREQIWCSMYPGSLPLIFNGSVPGHEKMFKVRRCSMYTVVQFDRFHFMSELSLLSFLCISLGREPLPITFLFLKVMYCIMCDTPGRRPTRRSKTDRCR